MSKKTVLLFLLLTFLFFNNLLAETVVLKSGKTVEGKITETTDKYIKVDFQGVGITYYLDEIASIDGQAVVLPAAVKESAVGSVDKAEMIKELLELSGGKKQIENFPAMVVSGAEQWRGKLTPQNFEKLISMIRESYNADVMYQDVAGYLMSHFDEKHCTAFLDWLRSPLSRKMSKLEEQSSSLESLREIQIFSGKLQQTPPSNQRVQLMRELDQTLGASKFAIEMIIVPSFEMYKAIEPNIPEQKRLKGESGEESYRSKLNAQLEDPIKQNILITFLYTYKSVPDNELREYVDFWKTDQGQWCNNSMYQAFLDSLKKSSKKMGENFANALPKK